jgi:hypothetical protein
LLLLESGIRGLRKNSKGAVKMTSPRDQASNATLTSKRWSSADIRNGSATPPADFPAQIVPYAITLREINHPSKYSVVGENSSPDPMAQRMPWETIRCQICVAKLERMSDAAVMKSPRGPG